MAKGTMQRFLVLGRLGTDPDIKETKGFVVAKLNVATTDFIKNPTAHDKSEFQEETEWHHITCFGKNAIFCRDYLKKGDAVYLEAKLRVSRWKDQEGKERSNLDIIAQSVQQVRGKGNNNSAVTVGSEV